MVQHNDPESPFHPFQELIKTFKTIRLTKFGHGLGILTLLPTLSKFTFNIENWDPNIKSMYSWDE